MDIIALAILTFIASVIGTFTGFGSSTIMVPFMVLLLPLPVALFFVGIIHTANDIWKIILFRKNINWKLLLTFGIPGIVASVIGAKIALSSPQDILTRILGAVLIGYVALLVAKPKFQLPHTLLSAGIGGTISGVLAGAFGVGGPARSMFLSAYNFKKEFYLFASGSIALLIDLARLTTYFQGGTLLPSSLALGLIVYIPVSFVGAIIAKRLVGSVPQDKFRSFVAVFIFVVGIKLLFFPS